jgi:hypothetical protein
MENPEIIEEQKLAWIEECLSVSRRTTSALQRNDLAALEECLEQEAQLFSRRPMFHRMRVRIPSPVIADLRSVNSTNRALIANGLDLARTLLNTIHPPATYSLQPGVGSVSTSTTQPAISVKC